MTSAPPPPSMVSAPEPPEMVLPRDVPTIDMAVLIAVAVTLVKFVTVGLPLT